MVFVVAETRLYREAVVRALQGDDRFRLTGAAADATSAITALQRLPRPPQVLLLDQALTDGHLAVRPLVEAAPGMEVVAITVDEEERNVLSWVEAGAAGFVSRDASFEHLLANVAAVARGETLCSPRLAAVLVNRVAALANERRNPSDGMAGRAHIAAAGVASRGADQLGIRLLGNLGVHRGSVPLPAFPTQRSEALFAYLVIHRDRLIHRDVLCGQFWGDRPDAQARKSLRTTLWRIRSVIEARPSDRGSILHVEGDHIGFVASAQPWVDVWALEDCVRMSEENRGAFDEATARRLEFIGQLYRGDFMEGHYDDWCFKPREQFRSGFLSALERLVEHHVEKEDWLGAIRCARQILGHDPLREHVHRALMASHRAMGDRPSALRQYQHCARVLRNELAIEPMEETRVLYEQIRGNSRPCSPDEINR
jgi:DNA-binding SARP family transcriptional activator/DNA-binding NarL/FixJ family response regulator